MENLQRLSVGELKNILRLGGVRDYYHKTKQELIQMITANNLVPITLNHFENPENRAYCGTCGGVMYDPGKRHNDDYNPKMYHGGDSYCGNCGGVVYDGGYAAGEGGHHGYDHEYGRGYDHGYTRGYDHACDGGKYNVGHAREGSHPEYNRGYELGYTHGYEAGDGRRSDKRRKEESDLAMQRNRDHGKFAPGYKYDSGFSYEGRTSVEYKMLEQEAAEHEL